MELWAGCWEAGWHQPAPGHIDIPRELKKGEKKIYRPDYTPLDEALPSATTRLYTRLATIPFEADQSVSREIGPSKIRSGGSMGSTI